MAPHACAFPEVGVRRGGRALTGGAQRRRATRRHGWGQWQRVEGEFEAPKDTAKCWVLVEKGTEGAMEIDAYLDEVRIEPISTLQVFERYRLAAASAAARAPRHPPAPLSRYRARGAVAPGDSKYPRGCLAGGGRSPTGQFDRTTPYREHDCYSGDEQLWQREVGNTMPTLAIAYLLTKEVKHSTRRARGAGVVLLSNLGSGPPGWHGPGHRPPALGLALVYDWCYQDLGGGCAPHHPGDTGSPGRQDVRGRRDRQGRVAARLSAEPPLGEYLRDAGRRACPLRRAGRRPPLGGACPGEAAPHHRGARPGRRQPRGRGLLAVWRGALLKLMHLSRELLAADFYDHPWWKNTAAHALYLPLPRQVWTRRNCIVDIADCPRGNWYGPDYILRGLARDTATGTRSGSPPRWTRPISMRPARAGST